MSFKSLLYITACIILSACSSGSNTQTPVDAVNNEPIEQTQVLADNSAKSNETVTASGLSYEVLKGADGPKPTATSVVTVHYVGTLLDGTEFDSSYSRGQPATFALNRTIEGWIEGVQLMSVGSKYRFTIPPELAYGDRGAGDRIGPGETLHFEVELLEINSN